MSRARRLVRAGLARRAGLVLLTGCLGGLAGLWGLWGLGVAEAEEAAPLEGPGARLPARGLRVVDGAGRALAGVELVDVVPDESGRPLHDADRPAAAITDEHGWIEAPPSPRPGVTRFLRRAGNVLTPLPEHLPAVLTLVGSSPLQGQVVRADGSVLPRAFVRARPLEGGGPAHLVRLDGEGNFRVPWAAPGRWSLQLLRPDGAHASLGLAEGGAPSPRVVLPRGALVRGRIQDGDAHAPAHGLVVRLHRYEASAGPEGGPALGEAAAEVVCDARGRFSVADLPPGLYTASVPDGRFVWDGVPPRFEVTAPRPVRLETWWIRQRGSVRGIVREATTRAPIAQAAVRVVAPPDALAIAGGRMPREPVRTAADGSFRVEGIAPDAGYRIVVEAPGRGTVVGDPFEVLGGRTTNGGIVLLLRAWTLDVGVFDPEGRPVEGASLLATPQSRPAPAEGDPVAAALVRVARSGAEGTARLADLPVEDLRLEVSAPGFVPGVVEVPQPAPGGARALEVRLARTLSVEGVLESRLGVLPALLVRARPRDGGPERQARPTSSGAFRIADLMPSPVDLDVLAADGPTGLVLVRRESVIPGSGERVVLEVPSPLRLDGIVEGVAAGQPPATVRLEAERWDPRLDRDAAVVVAEARLPAGEGAVAFGFPAVPPGRYALRAAQGARDSGPVSLVLRETDAAGLTLRLPEAARVTGVVYDARRFTPALGATIRLVRLDGEDEAPASGTSPPVATADELGQFAFAGLAPGLWRLEATDRAAVAPPVVVRVREGELLRAPDLALSGGGRIEGRIRSPTDTPLAGLLVRIARRADLIEVETARSDDEGVFRSGPLAAGRYRLRVAGGLATEGALEADVEVLEGETTSLAWAPRDRGRIDGTVRRRGTAIAGATVELTRTGGRAVDRVLVRARTDAAGGFHFDGLGEGHYELRLLDGAVRTRTGLDLGRGDRLTSDLELGEGRITGLVRTLAGDPVAGARVLARPSKGAPEAEDLDEARVRTGPDGRFVLAGLPVGRYDVVVSPAGRVSRVVSQVLADVPGSERLLEVVLGVGALLDVEVFDRGGRGIGAAEVWIENAAGIALHPRPFLTPASGLLRVEGLPEGEIRVVVRARGLGSPRPARLRVRDGLLSTTRLVLVPPGGLELTVTTPGGPVARARVDLLREPDGEPVLLRRGVRSSGEGSAGHGETSTRGVLRVEDLEEGEYTVVVVAGRDREPVRARVSIRAGAVTEAQVTLR